MTNIALASSDLLDRLHVKARTVDSLVLSALVIWLIVGQRIVVPLFAFALPSIVPALYIALGVLAFIHRTAISGKRFVWLALSLIALLTAYLVQGALVGLSSLVFFVAMYVPLVIVHRDSSQRGLLMSIFQNVMAVTAVLGIVQFVLPVLGLPMKDLFNAYLPHQFVIANYNYIQKVSPTLNLYKSNGVFFLEPSYYSQFLAIAILCEILVGKFAKRLLFYIPAFLLTFSGTGVIVLAAGLAVLLVRKDYLKRILLPALILASFSVFFFLSSYGQYWLARIGEFQRQNTSAYVRFIGPAVVFSNYLSQASSQQLWFGNGPGTVEEALRTQYSTLDLRVTSFVVKLLFEYGFVAGIVFLTFLIVAYFDRPLAYPIAFSLFILQLGISGLLQVQTLYLGFLLTMFFPKMTGIQVGAAVDAPDVAPNDS